MKTETGTIEHHLSDEQIEYYDRHGIVSVECADILAGKDLFSGTYVPPYETVMLSLEGLDNFGYYWKTNSDHRKTARIVLASSTTDNVPDRAIPIENDTSFLEITINRWNSNAGHFSYEVNQRN